MKHLLFAFIGLFIIGCSSSVETITKEITVLRASAIYDYDSVKLYMEKYKDTHKTIAESYIEKAKKEIDKNPEKAIYFFKRAITMHPNLESYKLLAIELEKNTQYRELTSLYFFLIYPRYRDNGDNKDYIFGTPDKDICYEFIVSSIRQYKYLSGEELYQVEEIGINVDDFKRKLLADERLHLDTASKDCKTMMLQFLSYDDRETYAKSPAVFNEFLKTVEDTAAVYTVDSKSIVQFDYEKFNGRDEREGQITFDAIYVFYLKEKQEEKDRWYNYNFKHRYPVSPAISAVIYAIDSSTNACPVEMRDVYYRLVTYDNATATIIDSKVIAMQAGEKVETVKMNKLNFTVSEYKRTFRKPYVKGDFDNYVTNSQFIAESSYEVTSDGKILEKTTALN